jgi:hypothetical protein
VSTHPPTSWPRPRHASEFVADQDERLAGLRSGEQNPSRSALGEYPHCEQIRSELPETSRIAVAVGGKRGSGPSHSPDPPKPLYRLAVIVCGLFPVFFW